VNYGMGRGGREGGVLLFSRINGRISWVELRIWSSRCRIVRHSLVENVQVEIVCPIMIAKELWG
jgi:hypothetical protein